MTLRKNALVSLLMAMFLFTVFVPLASAQTAGNSNLEQQMVEQINQTRAQKNLPPLQQDYTLASAAREQAQKTANSYSNNYDTLYQLLNSGKYQTMRMQILRATNIVELANSQLSNANSPALQAQYNVIGVGVVDSKYFGKVAVQIFAQAQNASQPSQEQQPKPEQPQLKPEQPQQPEQPSPAPESKPQPKPSNPEQPPVGNSQLSAFQNRVAELVNQERAKEGLQPLVVKMDLTNVAQVKAEDMATNRYFSHTSPTYGSPFDMMKKFGINYSYAGENIAMGYTTPESVMEGWMNSPGHKKNILNPNFKEIGVGYTASGNYWVQMFASR